MQKPLYALDVVGSLRARKTIYLADTAGTTRLLADSMPAGKAISPSSVQNAEGAGVDCDKDAAKQAALDDAGQTYCVDLSDPLCDGGCETATDSCETTAVRDSMLNRMTCTTMPDAACADGISWTCTAKGDFTCGCRCSDA